MPFKKARVFIALLFAFFVNTTQAQQDAMYTQYMFNMMTVNPGYAGSKGSLSAMLLMRQQWVGYEGAPSTQTFSVHSPIISKNIGLGFTFVRDKVGPVEQTASFLDFAYHLKVSPKAKLAMGLKAGTNFLRTNLSNLNVTDIGDEAFNVNLKSKFMPNFGFGLYYYTPKYYIGASTPKLIENKMSSTGNYETASVGNEKRHYFFVGGYAHKINHDFVFRPSFLVKKVAGAPVSVDLSASVLYKEWIWFGLAHRFGDSFGAIVQCQLIENLWLGYAYDYTITALTRYNTGSHEIMLTYDLRLLKNKIKSPRYF